MHAQPDMLSPATESQRRYRNNFARHVIGLALHLQSEIMEALTQKHGHRSLQLNFEPYLALAENGGVRLSDMASELGISPQAANQAVNQIVAAGYLARRPDPRDGRARLLVMTPKARKLVKQGAREALVQQRLMSAYVSAEELQACCQTLATLRDKLQLRAPGAPAGNDADTPLSALLPALADHISSTLMLALIERGHPRLKRSFAQVLLAIGPGGGRIQQMARAHGVSKQAISAIASELEELGYIERREDPEDARQLRLHFTAQGQRLIDDSVAGVDALFLEFAALTGKAALGRATAVLASIYSQLQLEEDVFGEQDSNDIHLIARRLVRQLGQRQAHQLARLLLSTAVGSGSAP